jgi:metallo-beta-lactamase class B
MMIPTRLSPMLCLTAAVALASASAAPGLRADEARSADTLSAISKLAGQGDLAGFDWQASFPHWFAPIAPFRIIGNGEGAVYYVGTQGLGMFFIPTAEGHIVIDGGMPGQGRLIADNIEALGYNPGDIQILLNSHAHLDHSGGLAELMELSGASLVASAGDRSALEGGFALGAEDLSYLNTPPVAVSREIDDGETVTLGGVTLTAHLTPGHTRGCTSWTTTVEQDGKPYETLFFCSASVAANRLVGPPQYEGIVDDYRKTFALTATWRPDIFLANHAEFFDMQAKRDKQIAGDALAFYNREDFPRMRAMMAQAFEAALQEQTRKLQGGTVQ